MVTGSWAPIIPGSRQPSIGWHAVETLLWHNRRTPRRMLKLVCFVYLVHLVCLVYQTNETNQINQITVSFCWQAFSASCCASCASSGPMVGYRHCIWSGGKACGRRTGRRIYRSGSAGGECPRPALTHVACRVGDSAPPPRCTR